MLKLEIIVVSSGEVIWDEIWLVSLGLGVVWVDGVRTREDDGSDFSDKLPGAGTLEFGTFSEIQN